MAVLAACLAGLGLPADGTASPATAPARESSPPVSVTTPGCTDATAPAPALRGQPTALEPVRGSPFGVVVTSDGRWSFVSMSHPSSVGVFRISRPGLPFLVRQVDIRQAYAGGPLYGEALTPGDGYLLAADAGNGAVVISVSRAESGQPGAVLGFLGSQPGVLQAIPGKIRPLGGAIEVAVSPDGRFAFVSLEYSASIAVYSLQQALTKGFSAADLVGMIPAGTAPVGMAVSPDGRWLYATSEISGRAAPGGQGTLTVISMARAESEPAASVVATVNAGCSPVRVITSPDGSVVWVTARESNRVLGFSAARLRSDPGRSLIASVGVGEEPVSLTLADHGQRIVVADSNQSDIPGVTSNLAVVDVAAALAGRPALLGYLQAGGFPRQMALEPSGQALLVTNFDSSQLEAAGVANLP